MMLKKSERLKNLRKKLGLNQSDLTCKGLDRAAICKIETGEKQLNPRQAFLLARRFTEIGYSISMYTLLGVSEQTINSTIEAFLVDTNNCKKFDALLDKLWEDEAIETILRIEKELDKDIYKNADVMLKYFLKLMLYKLDKETYLKVNIKLIRVYTALGCTEGYKRAIETFYTVEYNMSNISKSEKVKCYYNVALSYKRLKKYDLSLDLLNKIERLKITGDFYFRMLTLKANMLAEQGRFKESIRINSKIIEKAVSLNLYNYIANSEGNISDILLKEDKLNEAKTHIDSAFELFDNVDNYYKFNILESKLNFEIKNSTVSLELFERFINLAVKFDKIHMGNGIKQIMDYCIKNNKSKEKFISIIDFLSKKDIELEASIKINIIEHFTGKSFEQMIS